MVCAHYHWHLRRKRSRELRPSWQYSELCAKIKRRREAQAGRVITLSGCHWENRWQTGEPNSPECFLSDWRDLQGNPAVQRLSSQWTICKVFWTLRKLWSLVYKTYYTCVFSPCCFEQEGTCICLIPCVIHWAELDTSLMRGLIPPSVAVFYFLGIWSERRTLVM